MCPTKRMWARIDCGVLTSSRGLKTQLCCVSVGASEKEMPQERAQSVGRASRKVMHDVRVMAKGALGGTLPVRDGLWRSGHGPSGQEPKDERQREAS